MAASVSLEQQLDELKLREVEKSDALGIGGGGGSGDPDDQQDSEFGAAPEALEDDAVHDKSKKISDNKSQPTAVIVIGMAGSGKTTLMKRMNAHLKQHKLPTYVVNLDPAVLKTQYPCNIDIRDTVDYKRIMHEYELGPNGGIMTALNLFATRFDQVMGFIERKNAKPPKAKKDKKDKKSKKSKKQDASEMEEPEQVAKVQQEQQVSPSAAAAAAASEQPPTPQRGLDYVLLDTPGQIEIFTWSASGSIITDSLASSFPSVVLYVVDTPRNATPATFMSNMMYACSIMYKTKLPLLVVFNKTDVMSCQFAKEWMGDFEKFCDALNVDNSSHMSDLTRSMSLVLDEFYNELTAVGVSSLTGAGMRELFEAIEKARGEYFENYLPMLQFRKLEAARRKEETQLKELAKYKESRGDRGEEEIDPSRPLGDED